jgi:hypothetical protein
MIDYEIQPSTLRCAATGRELQPGDACYSALIETAQGLQRIDFAADAWPGVPPHAIGFWRSKVPPPSASRRRAPVDDSAALELFEQLNGCEEPRHVSFRYILGLLLLRRKVLKLFGSARDGPRELLLLRSPSTGHEHQVVNPELSDEEMLEVQSEVNKILQGE